MARQLNGRALGCTGCPVVLFECNTHIQHHNRGVVGSKPTRAASLYSRMVKLYATRTRGVLAQAGAKPNWETEFRMMIALNYKGKAVHDCESNRYGPSKKPAGYK